MASVHALHWPSVAVQVFWILASTECFWVVSGQHRVKRYCRNSFRIWMKLIGRGLMVKGNFQRGVPEVSETRT